MSYKEDLKNFNSNFLNDLGIKNKPYYVTSILNVILYKYNAKHSCFIQLTKTCKLYKYFNVREINGIKFVNSIHISELIYSQIIK